MRLDAMNGSRIKPMADLSGMTAKKNKNRDEDNLAICVSPSIFKERGQGGELNLVFF